MASGSSTKQKLADGVVDGDQLFGAWEEWESICSMCSYGVLFALNGALLVDRVMGWDWPSVVLLTISVINMYMFFARRRTYQLLDKRNPRLERVCGSGYGYDSPALRSPNLVRRIGPRPVDPDELPPASISAHPPSGAPTWIARVFGRRRHVVPQHEYWELNLWHPHDINRLIFTCFSPVQVVAVMFAWPHSTFLTAAHAYLRWLHLHTSLIVVAGGGLAVVQLWWVVRAYERRLEDAAILARGAYAEAAAYAEQSWASWRKVATELHSQLSEAKGCGKRESGSEDNGLDERTAVNTPARPARNSPSDPSPSPSPGKQSSGSKQDNPFQAARSLYNEFPE